ncbi:hypothetical protein EGH51_16790 [Klebsiella aerogenes]|nr:hypothetical protein YA23_18725 [Klebsiella aerogenes]KZQ62850.1 hypothetical protein A3N43_25350 [Klebsiella aerogenes]RSW02771.1 hypothetical protein EGH51_16790 [Klebsiella aerogenes]
MSSTRCFDRHPGWRRFAKAINRAFRLAESLKNAAKPEILLCRCEDVRCGDMAAAAGWPLAPARAETLIALARLSAEP